MLVIEVDDLEFSRGLGLGFRVLGGDPKLYTLNPTTSSPD